MKPYLRRCSLPALIDIDDIEREFSRLNGLAQGDFFARYIYGAERIPLAQFLSVANIETKQEGGQTIFKIRAETDTEQGETQLGMFGQLR